MRIGTKKRKKYEYSPEEEIGTSLLGPHGPSSFFGNSRINGAHAGGRTKQRNAARHVWFRPHQVEYMQPNGPDDQNTEHYL